METINLPARYGYIHKLERIDDTSHWVLKLDPKSCGTYRIIGFEGQEDLKGHCFALDPEGGPFLSVGTKIENKTIKSITADRILELEENVNVSI